ncbi:hypothetical protein [Clostridium estertheticum]|nr:hypothetical protein [Clostridium estertheticum]
MYIHFIICPLKASMSLSQTDFSKECALALVYDFLSLKDILE